MAYLLYGRPRLHFLILPLQIRAITLFTTPPLLTLLLLLYPRTQHDDVRTKFRKLDTVRLPVCKVTLNLFAMWYKRPLL